MSRINLLLLVLIVLSAFSVVTTQQRVTASYAVLEKELVVEKAYNTEWGQLQIEQTTLSKHESVERKAKDALNMQAAEGVRMKIVLPEGVDFPEEEKAANKKGGR